MSTNTRSIVVFEIWKISRVPPAHPVVLSSAPTSYPRVFTVPAKGA